MTGSIPNCTNIYGLDNGEEYNLLDDGQLYHVGYGLTELYCVDKSMNITGHLNNLVLKCEDLYEELLVRIEDDCPIDNKTMHVFFTALGIISLFFLIITFIVYVSIPDLFNLHGKVVISNVGCTFCVTTYILIVYNFTLVNPIICTLVGYFGYFVSVSMFAWMTVVCLDLYSTFGCSLRPVEDSDTSKFLIYSLSSWGIPAILTAIVFTADNLLAQGSEIKPNIGLAECFIQSEGYGRMVFFHIPILAIMIFNLVLYLVTVYSLTKDIRQTASARHSIR